VSEFEEACFTVNTFGDIESRAGLNMIVKVTGRKSDPRYAEKCSGASEGYTEANAKVYGFEKCSLPSGIGPKLAVEFFALSMGCIYKYFIFRYTYECECVGTLGSVLKKFCT
jgi:hypothetical protein